MAVSFKPIKNLGNIIKNNKDRLEKENWSGVYKLTCNDDPMVYEWQNTRHPISTNQTTPNILIIWSFNHNFEVLHKEEIVLCLLLLEAL